jgi:hypothetical protein
MEAIIISILFPDATIKPLGLAVYFCVPRIEGYYTWDLVGIFVGPVGERSPVPVRRKT